MHRPSFVTSALLAGVAAIGISACGSSSSSSSSGSSSAAASSAAGGGGGSDSGSAFCQQAAQVASQLTHLTAGLIGTSPGATPSVQSFQQVFATTAQAIDSLDGSAPGAIASQFHEVRAAYDQANQQVQAATSLSEMGTALTAVDSPSLQAANTGITNYFQSVCGITPNASTPPTPTPT